MGSTCPAWPSMWKVPVMCWFVNDIGASAGGANPLGNILNFYNTAFFWAYGEWQNNGNLTRSGRGNLMFAVTPYGAGFVLAMGNASSSHDSGSFSIQDTFGKCVRSLPIHLAAPDRFVRQMCVSKAPGIAEMPRWRGSASSRSRIIPLTPTIGPPYGHHRPRPASRTPKCIWTRPIPVATAVAMEYRC